MANDLILFAKVDWDAVLSGFGAAVLAILGAVLAYLCALRLESVQKRKRIDGILSAIHCELTVMRKAYDDDIGSMLKNTQDTQPFDRHFSMMTEKYFIVYPSNTEIVGQIDDDGLVNAIVTTYTKANLLIECYRMNNWYLERKEELKANKYSAERELFAIKSALASGGKPQDERHPKRIEEQLIPDLDKDLVELNTVRINHTKGLKDSDAELHQEIETLLVKIKDYRKRLVG